MRIPIRSRERTSASWAWGCLFLIAASGIAVPAAVAEGDASYRERMMMQEQSRKLSEEAEFTSEVCGTRISVSLHWESFLARDGRVSSGVYRECDGALAAIERICRDESKVEALREKVRRVECGGGKKNRVRLEDGTLRYAISKGGGSHQEVYDYLRGRL